VLTYLVAFLVSMSVAAVATPLVTRWAIRNHWFDLPTEARKVHTRAIPRLGGIAVVTAFFAPLVGLAIYTNRISGLLYADARLFSALCLGAAAIVALGIYDDLKGASARLKLVVQAAVAAGMWFAGFQIERLGNPFGDPIHIGLFSLPVTMLWIIGVVNALNLIDGLDGLASGIALFAALVLFGVSFVDHAVLLCLLTAALGGALVGFLFFNFNPARIFLGDSGSMFLGFVLASISVWTQRKGATAAALLTPVIALGVPLLDTTLSFLRRIARRQSPFKADREHLHHRLLALGLSHRGAVFTLYTMSGIFALSGLALLDNDTTHRAIVFSVVAMVTFILVRNVGLLEAPAILSRSPAESSFLRSEFRLACRRIRDASDLDGAWRAVTEASLLLGLEEVRLAWAASSPGAAPERRETVFSWQKMSGGRWRLDGSTSVPHRAQRLLLEEGADRFGELVVLGAASGRRTLDQQVTLELLREALIEFAATQERTDDLRPGAASAEQGGATVVLLPGADAAAAKVATAPGVAAPGAGRALVLYDGR
jgi:UDP-GlcNAc:undecaprenyl-phosphate GlcNAc-1-phosphate transferase